MIAVYTLWLSRIWFIFILVLVVLTLFIVFETIYGARIAKVWRDFKEVIQWARDRYWFYYVIEGDEFHHSLNIDLKKCSMSWEAYYKEIARINKGRARAHKLDAIYNGYSRGMVL
jgi:hypothetical protein